MIEKSLFMFYTSLKLDIVKVITSKLKERFYETVIYNGRTN